MDPRQPMPMRKILARILDDSSLSEFKARGSVPVNGGRYWGHYS